MMGLANGKVQKDAARLALANEMLQVKKMICKALAKRVKCQKQNLNP